MNTGLAGIGVQVTFMDKDSWKFLQELCDIPGPPGFEAAATRLMKDYAEGYCDRVFTDKLGNTMFEKVGQKDGPIVLLAGHIDECGFIITGVNPQGYLAFSQLGGWFDQVLLGQRVLVHTRKGALNGVIACKPPHLMEPEEAKKVVTKDKMFIDIGASNKDEAQAMGVRLGDAVTPDSKFFTMEKQAYKDGKPAGKRTIVFGRAFDNRLGAFASVELLKALRKGKVKHPNRLIAAATVQEEVGLRGARTVAASTNPDVAIVLDVDIAGDIPGIDPLQAPARMGEGISITVFDGNMIPNQPLKELVISICEKKKIPHQLAYVIRGGTDGGLIHTSLTGVPTIAIGVPTRHIHSHVGLFDTADLDACMKLVIELAKALDRKTVDSLTAI
ncbi:MAG: M42 family metallopeptidase [Methanomassiliicoccales archaeon]|jgi:endoglucanase|nr:M42 family metallopeptidase [Methanomassiliicoccales archaeon]